MLPVTYTSLARSSTSARPRAFEQLGLSPEAMFALVQHELHMNEVDYSIWTAFGTVNPAYVVTHDGVPIVSIYRRP